MRYTGLIVKSASREQQITGADRLGMRPQRIARQGARSGRAKARSSGGNGQAACDGTRRQPRLVDGERQQRSLEEQWQAQAVGLFLPVARR
ncbi:hypothetical protein P3T76_012723 [Phytophthora citrophthora]|uniref:Uncharacterized protein n=1 Tax=Phytophthora citrophthora TaxID=4793 RepID=A0AAD9LCV5_9STRA|nr:hypothetical protein P3T76_012723 [Phytophthora citrophthora]